MREAVLETTPFTSYVVEDYSRRAGSAADLTRLITENGMKKIPSSTAAELAWQYAQCGAAVGAIDSMRAQAMFELSHRGVSKEQWDRAHSAGLAIPKEQDNLSYAEVEQEENLRFLGLLSAVVALNFTLHCQWTEAIEQANWPCGSITDEHLHYQEEQRDEDSAQVMLVDPLEFHAD